MPDDNVNINNIFHAWLPQLAALITLFFCLESNFIQIRHAFLFHLAIFGICRNEEDAIVSQTENFVDWEGRPDWVDERLHENHDAEKAVYTGEETEPFE